MIVDELFDVMHNLSIPPVGCGGHLGQDVTALFINGCGLGVEHEWNSKETLSAISVGVLEMMPFLLAVCILDGMVLGNTLIHSI